MHRAIFGKDFYFRIFFENKTFQTKIKYINAEK
jgi:hypothetical protein